MAIYLHDDWIGLNDHMVHIAPAALYINHTYIYSEDKIFDDCFR
jgi:hypothetical protein